MQHNVALKSHKACYRDSGLLTGNFKVTHNGMHTDFKSLPISFTIQCTWIVIIILIKVGLSRDLY